MPLFAHDGIRFNFRESAASGTPFFFQHGLGADLTQPFSLFAPPLDVRMIAFDARGHGATEPLGPPEKLRFDIFADDLRTLMEYLRIRSAIVGGISMGAGVALNFAVRYVGRATALVLSRPAWLEKPHGWNVRMFTLIAELLREHGPVRGQELFRQTSEYADTLQRWPEVAASLEAQFGSPHVAETACKFESIIQDTPCADRRRWRAISVPTLVLANRHDPIHPFEFGEELAREIPGAELVEITSKSVSVDQHTRDVQAALEAFVRRVLKK
ncbi:MAG: alpha/beta hydrolase [Verrucomicrobia subdivision 3 bacterium]|nr:alpha/beta hydrolase [Limisphaerales bacterium]